MTEDIERMISEMAAKDAHVLCREVMSINDTMDVLRAKWNVEILTAILCGQTRFKDMQSVVKGISEKVLSDRLRQLADDKLIEKQECYGYPPRCRGQQQVCKGVVHRGCLSLWLSERQIRAWQHRAVLSQC